MQPVISIIIPSYNDSRKLPHLLTSIANQTYNNFEVIIIDGGSKDDTLDVIARNKSLVNYFISENDDGIFDAMNKGINKAKGLWLFFIGCDDLLYDSNTLEAVFGGESHSNVDVLYGKIYNATKEETIGEEINSKEELLQSQFWHQGMFYKKISISNSWTL